MRQERTNKNWIVLVAVLLTVPVLAGCFGDDDKPEPGDDGNKAIVDPDKEKDGTERRDDMSGGLNDPSAHYHHYWGDRTEVIIYSGGVPFHNYDTGRYPTTLAWAEFSPEDDGDNWDDGNDLTPDSPEPVTTEGIADTVFAGTERIEVFFPEAANWPAGVRMMYFQWKPSNVPDFVPDIPMTVYPGDVKTIRLTETGESDPPHQFSTSRWKFRLQAATEACETFSLPDQGCPPGFIQDPNIDPDQGSKYYWGSRSGGDGIEMRAYTSGDKHLDPPHPNFWADGDVRDLGTVSGEVDLTVQTPLVREKIHSMNDIAMPPNNIVPLGTEKVEVKLRWDNTAQVGGDDVVLDLYYHGADTIEYEKAPAPRQEGDWLVYELYDTENGLKVDPPYESNSFWRFKLVPVYKSDQIEQKNLGTFEGEWTMQFSAHKRDGYVLE